MPDDDNGRKVITEANNYEAEEGRLLKKGDMHKAFIGNGVAKKELFKNKNIALGNKIKINGVEFGVVGILKKSGNPQQDRVIIVPEDSLREVLDIEKEKVDITQPSLPLTEHGHFHPMTIVHRELEELFSSMGFMVLDGPELESTYYAFETLNIPATSPAREGMDTFYIKDHSDWCMRPHTSPVQVRAMQKYGAPLRTVVTGRCFRNESTDASHEHTFYQMEGLMIGKDISISNLIGVMKTLLRGVFKRDVKVRLRPGYFPFVEPGFELDINCLICGGKGCSVCKNSGWLELLPCGMVHPNVLKFGGLDPNKYSGFAFGLGLTRLAMMKYGIDDIRLLCGGDLRFLKQF